jgi:hypothetical protein
LLAENDLLIWEKTLIFLRNHLNYYQKFWHFHHRKIKFVLKRCLVCELGHLYRSGKAEALKFCFHFNYNVCTRHNGTMYTSITKWTLLSKQLFISLKCILRC